MVDKVTLTNLANLQNETTAVSAINTNSAAITTAMNNTLSRDGTLPNQMGANLDMNSYRILNLPEPSLDTEPLRVIDGASLTAGGTITVSSSNLAVLFGTRANAIAATIAGGTQTIRTSGYTTVNDGGGATYKKVLVSETGGFTSADGAKWAIADTIVNAKSLGAVGDGITNDTTALQNAIDLCFHTFASLVFSPSGYLQRELFIPAGNYLINTPLVLDGKWGATITGAGKFTTTIRNDVTGTGVFTANGARDLVISNMNMQGKSGGTENVFNLWWDGASFINTTENVIRDCQIGDGGIGIHIHGSQSDICQVEFCQFGGQTTAGIKVDDFNNLGHSAIGCQFQACNIGIQVLAGSIPVISGCEFQASTLWDIKIEGSANDSYLISGCRSETTDNFLDAGRGNIHLAGCAHLGTNNGIFVQVGEHPITITGCISTKGTIQSGGGSKYATIAGCEFGRSVSTWIEDEMVATVDNTLIGGTSDLGGGTHYENYIWDNGFGTSVGAKKFALTDAATITTDARTGNVFTVTLGGNRTLANPTNLPTVSGDPARGNHGFGTYTWYIKQDGTGGRTLLFDSMFKFWGGGTSILPSFDLTPDTVNVITAQWDGVSLHACVNSTNPSLTTSAPNTQTGATYSLLKGDYAIIANFAGTTTLTLPNPTRHPGRILRVKTIQAQTVVSANSDVVPLVGGAAGTAILAATAGKWADLQSDGTNWIIMASN